MNGWVTGLYSLTLWLFQNAQRVKSCNPLPYIGCRTLLFLGKQQIYVQGLAFCICQRVQKNWMVKSQRVKYEFSIRYYIILTKMSACNQILGKTFGPKTMAPTEMKNFCFSLFFFFFSFFAKNGGRKIIWGDFPWIFHYYLHFVFKIGMLEIKNCFV